MTSDRLARDYLRRAQARRKALDAPMASVACADVVRESQEIVELILKGHCALSASRRQSAMTFVPSLRDSSSACQRRGVKRWRR